MSPEATTVSAIVTAYNCAPFIAEALDSILAQTRPPDEIIVVNDGSTDGTRDAVAPYLARGVKYLEQPNGGISAARNAGLRAASGTFVTFLDGDDRWRPELVATLAAVLDHDEALVCAFSNLVRFEHASGRMLSEQFRYYPGLTALASAPGPAGSRILTGDAFTALVRFGEIPCFMQVTMFRASRIAGMRFNEALYLGEDYEFALRAYLRGGVGVVPQVLAEVRRHDTNTTRDFRYFPVYKRQALLALAPEVRGEARLAAFRDRLVKAHVEASLVLVSRGRSGEGLRVFASAFGVPGSARRKVTGAARLAYMLVRRAAGARDDRGA